MTVQDPHSETSQGGSSVPSNVASPPATGDAYVDSCFRFGFDELEEERDWHEMADVAEIPRLANSGDNVGALALIDEALTRYPDYGFLYSWRGHVQSKLDLREEERQSYLEGIQKSRSKASLCDYLGQWEFKAGRLAEAVEWWIKSCAIQLYVDRPEYASPFLRLAYIAEGLGLTACHSALLEQVDRIQNIRLNAQGERECWALAASQGNASIKRGITLLCDFYLWGTVREEGEQEPELRSTEGTGAFLRTFAAHLQRVRILAPNLSAFLDRYFSALQLEELAGLAEEEMRRTVSDREEHSIAVPRPPLYFQVSTVVSTIDRAVDWFTRRHGGYTKILEQAWSSPLFRNSGCSIVCHVVYGHTGEEVWVHMALCPIGEASPIDHWVVPIEFLNDEERRQAGLA
jgi:hypothetical protein